MITISQMSSFQDSSLIRLSRQLSETKQASAAETASAAKRTADYTSRGQALAEVRMESMRAALVKLDEIRENQKAFLEDFREAGKPKSPIDDYMNLVNRLRLEMLNSPDERKQAASRYLDFAKL